MLIELFIVREVRIELARNIYGQFSMPYLGKATMEYGRFIEEQLVIFFSLFLPFAREELFYEIPHRLEKKTEHFLCECGNLSVADPF